MTIELARDNIPNGVKVLSFAPGECLRVRVPLPVVARIMFFIFSLALYLGAAQVVSYVFSAIFGPLPWILIGCNSAAILVCVLISMRGAVLTIFLSQPKYRLSSPVSLVVRDEVPKVEVTTTKKAGRWTSTLSIAEQAITTNTSGLSAEEAERPFAPFVEAFPQPADTAAIDQKAGPPTVDTADRSALTPEKERTPPDPLRPGRPHERPLIILVHGTWGQQSPWAFPNKSHLVSALKSRLSCEAEYRRHGWSGANRTGARIEAAARLTAAIRSELAEHDRNIFVLAHSHGGNIAVRAIGDLSDAEQRSVYAVLMATPFLWSGQRFDVRDVYIAMPLFVQQTLPMICLFGFWIASLVLIGALQRYLPVSARIDLLRGHGEISLWQLPLLIFYFLGPFSLFNITWRKGVESLKVLQKESAGREQRETSRDASRLLAISYNQDEAFQVLSLVINFLGLVHQIAFLAIIGIAWLVARTRLLDLLWKGAWIAFVFLLLVAFAIMDITTILAPFAGALVPIDWSLQIGEWLTKLLEAATNIDEEVIFLTLVGAGLVVVGIIFSMLMIGIVRVGIFTAIGVMDQIRSQKTFLNAILGTVAISVVPQGESETLLLPGRALFNHVKIYDDGRATDRIAQFIGDIVLKIPLDA